MTFARGSRQIASDAAKVGNEASMHDMLLLTAAISPPALLTVLLTSNVTPVGLEVYAGLGRLHALECQKTFGIMGGILLLLAYLSDVSPLPSQSRLHHKHAKGYDEGLRHEELRGGVAGWSKRWSYVAYTLYSCVCVCFIVALLSLSVWAPSIPILLGVAITFLPVMMMRARVLQRLSVEHFSKAVYIVFGGLAFVMGTLWVGWACTHRPVTVEMGSQNQTGDSLATYMVWASPIIFAALYAVIAMLAALRSTIHLPEDPNEPMDAKTANFVKSEARVAVLGVIAMVLLMWMTASIAMEDKTGLVGAIQRVGGAVLLTCVGYITIALGKERVLKAAEESPALGESLKILQCEWVMALGLLLALPLIPAYFIVEIALQQVRTHFHGEPPALLTTEARLVWSHMVSVDVTSVVTKAIYLGVFFFTFSVLFGQGIYVFLVWMNEAISSWSMAAILAVLFSVGLCLFMIPPVPGAPVYLLAGSLITEKGHAVGLSFPTCCAIAVTFCWFVKLGGALLQMKGVGQPLCESVGVKLMIGVHTPPMKAVRHILSEKGMHPSKVAVLLGGPDWPTSVLTGILGLSACEMMLGTAPVLFVVAPFALTSAFATQAQKVPEGDAQLYLTISSICMIVSTLMLLVAMAVAGYYIQETVEENHEKMEAANSVWEKDPQEDLVLELERVAKVEAETFRRNSKWPLLPSWVQGMLILGVMVSSVLLWSLLAPVDEPAQPFQSFTLSNHMSDLPGGSVFGLVRPIGWIAVYTFCAASSIAAVFQVWCSYAIAGPTGEVQTPLTDTNRN